MAKHTPGPWSASNPWYYPPEGGVFYFNGGQGYVFVGQSGEMYDHAMVLCAQGNDEGLANARLIAAAPELFEMVRRYASECAERDGTGLNFPGAPMHHHGCQACADIREMIAKAGG